MHSDIKIIKTRQSKLSQVDFDNIPFGRVFSDHMFEMDYKDGVWQDPVIRPFHNLQIHPAAMALHYGQAVFEGMKASRDAEGNPFLFRPEEHAHRINASARRLMMPEIPTELFMSAVKKLTWVERKWIPGQEGSALYLRPFIFASEAHVGVRPSEEYKFIILALPVGPYYNRPVSLLAERKFVRAVKGGVGEAKAAGNYAASLVPAQIAKNKGYDQVLWLDAKEFKYVQEVGTMNIFFVMKGNKVITPATDGAILKGITRKSIIEILKRENIEVEERKISIDEVKKAYSSGELQEVFGSGTAAVVAHVNKVADGDFIMEFDESNWELSSRIKKYINSLRNGTMEDTYGWIYHVNEEVPA